MNNEAILPSARPVRVPPDTCVFSIDVEDWFHIMDLPTAPRIEQWHALPSLVAKNFFMLLDMLDTRGIKATCFFLGWVAERIPRVVREAVRRGHEVASHGFAHGLVYDMSPKEFLADASKARNLLEQIAGTRVRGYRAPGFSVTARTPWFFEMLAQAGYRYDSSVFPANRQHGGLRGFPLEPCVIDTARGAILEVPISVARQLGTQTCFFGGGYLRVFPYVLIRHMVKRVLDDGRPVVFYIHPREIDPTHPRLPMPLARRIKSYIGLRRTEKKLERLLNNFNFMPFAKLLEGALDFEQSNETKI